MALGLPVDDLDELFESAMKLGRAMGISTLDAVQSLTTGIGRQSTMILDNLGITFRSEEAYSFFARSIGKTTDQLTDSEKKLAWQSFAMSEVTTKASALGDVEDGLLTSQEQLAASQKNLNTSIGESLGPLGQFKGIFDTLSPALSTMAMVSIPKILDHLPDLAKGLGSAGIGAKSLAIGAAGAIAAFTLGYSIISSLPENLRAIGFACLAAVAGVVTLTAAYLALNTTISWGTAALIIIPAVALAVGGLMSLMSSAQAQATALAEGGIITKPTFALIGESGPEAVIPLRHARATGGFSIREVNNYFYGVNSDLDLDRYEEQMSKRFMRNLERHW